MFTNKKKNYRSFIFTGVLITLCLLVVALAWPEEQSQTINDGKDNTNDSVTVNNEDSAGKDSDDQLNNISQPEDSYYLVKRAGDRIVVYFKETTGDMVELETTQILYELLGPDDQRLFDEGVKLSNQEELGILLQDFES